MPSFFDGNPVDKTSAETLCKKYNLDLSKIKEVLVHAKPYNKELNQYEVKVLYQNEREEQDFFMFSNAITKVFTENKITLTYYRSVQLEMTAGNVFTDEDHANSYFQSLGFDILRNYTEDSGNRSLFVKNSDHFAFTQKLAEESDKFNKIDGKTPEEISDMGKIITARGRLYSA
jgi:hypothetical protein